MLIVAGVWITVMLVLQVFITGSLASLTLMVPIAHNDAAQTSGIGLLLVALGLAAILAGLLALRDFFRKRIETRDKVFFFCLALIVQKLVDFATWFYHDRLKIRPEHWTLRELESGMLLILLPAVWILYFSFSKRVESTFARQPD
jgi:hypothetical protein